MTETEKQQIISLVLQALKTNSLTIEQLTDTTELSKDIMLVFITIEQPKLIRNIRV